MQQEIVEICADPEPDPFVKACGNCGELFCPDYYHQVRCWKCKGKDFRKGDRHQTRAPDLRIRPNDRHRERDPFRPFIGVDGEGGGKDPLGRQNYLLMSASGTDGVTQSLFKGNAPLSTVQCLEFILSLPREAILVGFYFDYDVTQILRDLPQNRIERLLLPAEEKPSLWTNWIDYRLQYVPGQFFSVARLLRDPETGKVFTKPGSIRTINDVKGIFQEPFVRVIESWGVATPDELELVSQFKAARSQFEKITPEMQRYCETECRLLAATMTQFRQACEEPNLPVAMRPSKYRGAGYVAARMLQSTRFPTRKANNNSSRQRTQLPLSPEMQEVARAAYYSGRFEIFRTGYIGEPIYFYDCNSAYPAMLQYLPCPVRTQWRSVKYPTCSAYAAELTFQHPADSIWCGFPFRTQNGYVRYPQNGSGVYWSPEIEAAAALGAEIELRKVWEAVQCCDCRWFDWVEELYNYRVLLGSTTKGLPIKLGLNAISGKFAQRIGSAPWHNRVLAGLLTSMVRAMLIRAIADDPSAVVMAATDGLFSVRPLPSLELGTKLGAWKLKKLPDMFIVQSGFYWFPSASTAIAPHKTRGIPRSIVAQHADRFVTAWREFLRPYQRKHLPLVDAENVPHVPIPTDAFIGLKLAQQLRNGGMDDPPPAGSWQRQWWKQSFDWSEWRSKIGVCHGASVLHHPITGSGAGSATTSSELTSFFPLLTNSSLLAR